MLKVGSKTLLDMSRRDLHCFRQSQKLSIKKDESKSYKQKIRRNLSELSPLRIEAKPLPQNEISSIGLKYKPFRIQELIKDETVVIPEESFVDTDDA